MRIYSDPELLNWIYTRITSVSKNSPRSIYMTLKSSLQTIKDGLLINFSNGTISIEDFHYFYKKSKLETSHQYKSITTLF